MAKEYRANDLVGLIRAKYSGNAYAVLEQVANGTGSYCDSWIDATVFSLWPSNGIWRAACEVKVSRADFLNELAKPNKNQWAREHFDFFWYVVAPGVAKDDEIPTGCGLMVVRGGGLSVVKQAPRREDAKTDSDLIASFARSLDKERERFVKEGLREAIESDHECQISQRFREGCMRFLSERDTHCRYPSSADEVHDKLRDAALSKSPNEADAHQVQRCIERFQDHVIQFLADVAPLAAAALNARDELGEYVVRYWGGSDDKSVPALKAALKKSGRKTFSRAATKRAIQIREVLQEVAAASQADQKGDG